MSVLSLLPEDKRKDPRDSLESVYSSNSRLSLLQKRKRMNPMRLTLGQQQQHGEQRVLSAKMHRLKALQNQLADAHYHLQELSNENKILRALQKKQEIALQRYETSSAELPQVLSAHSEEMRVQQSKHRAARRQLRELEAQLRERDQRLTALADQHRHLLDLTRDRCLPERERLQAQVAELTARVQQQQETIGALQRRLALQEKNFRHQLAAEASKHRDTRHDLDLAISNADKLSTIIEIKEKMISTVASRSGGSRSPPKPAPAALRPPGRSARERQDERTEERSTSRLSENSRSVLSALAEDEPAPRAPADLARAVQDGMAELAIRDGEEPMAENPPKKMQAMKLDLMNKIRHDEVPTVRKPSALRRRSTDESIEEVIVADERPASRARRGSGLAIDRSKTIGGSGEPGRRLAGYCKDILDDIEKSSRVIDGHVQQLAAATSNGERIAEQLRAVDRVSELVSARGEVGGDALVQLQGEFAALSQMALAPKARRVADPLGDRSLSNRDLLDDLLGSK